MKLGSLIVGFFVMVILIIALTVGAWVGIGYLCVKAGKAVVDGDGLKGVATKVWNGTNNVSTNTVQVQK